MLLHPVFTYLILLLCNAYVYIHIYIRHTHTYIYLHICIRHKNMYIYIYLSSDLYILFSFLLVSGIPQYPYQPIEERPGYEDDPDVDEAAKHYSIVDYIVYKEYLKQDRMRSSSSKHVAKGRKSHSSIKSSIDLEPQLSSFDQAGVSEEKNPENEPTTSQTNVQ